MRWKKTLYEDVVNDDADFAYEVNQKRDALQLSYASAIIIGGFKLLIESFNTEYNFPTSTSTKF